MRKILPSLLGLMLAASATTLLACSVPVFRYAFEHWNPDAFTVTVYHHGELTESQQVLLHRLQPPGIDAAHVGNLQVKTVDLATGEAAVPEADWKAAVKPGTAWMTAHTPAKNGPATEIFSSEFTADNVARLLDSPARSVVTDHLLRGDSAVWVLLECGDRTADDNAAQVLTAELERLQKTLKLPEIEEKDIQDGLLTLDPAELKIRFTLVRIARDDPAEQAFVAMLKATEPDLNDPEFRDQPMALPLFGRGRSLWALIGKGINADTIEDTCRFLTGACQCTVKVQNPGVDILTTVDWNMLAGSAPESLQLDRESPAGEPEYLAIAPGSSSAAGDRATAAVEQDGTVSRATGDAPVGWLLGLGGFAVLMAGVSLSFVRRSA